MKLVEPFARRSLNVMSAAPIKGYNRRSFVVGWVAIVLVVAAGFSVAAGPLSYSTAETRVASVGSIITPSGS
ncbi:hypothetical protein [Pelagibacterium luteolum]|uniref:Uncharacterized protein n=1 Tax=Pelagibacterium luteolum TaxID=440168 RepID=A0A1G7UM07_9HYPH|nr:hypothetical protein [Pelagibacterium luteolum]SDG48271.1 hypothetical protein SAMN04487974_103137 [Pelagibacterium luteolum]